MSKKKVAVLTIRDIGNYGNRLQNYAVQKTLERFNYETVSLNLYKNIKLRYGKCLLQSVIYRLLNKKQKLLEVNRNKKFTVFTKKK
jgi:AICAR transformylase/IMP cyclohydrolase PurH